MPTAFNPKNSIPFVTASPASPPEKKIYAVKILRQTPHARMTHHQRKDFACNLRRTTLAQQMDPALN